MHEMAVTESILRIAVEEAEKRKASKVINIKIKLGSITGLVPQCIQEYFDIVSEGSVAEKAELIFDKIPAVIKCEKCEKESKMEHFRMICPFCGDRRVKVISGKEFYIESMEIED